jgi:hypothetical protein
VRHTLPRYQVCELSRRAPSRPARALHAAVAAPALLCPDPAHGIDCAACEPCPRRSCDGHIGARCRHSPHRTDRATTSGASCVYCASTSAHRRRRRGWGESAIGADSSRAGRRLGYDDGARAKNAGGTGSDDCGTCRPESSFTPVDCARSEAAIPWAIRSGRTAHRRRSVRFVARSRVRRRCRYRYRNRCGAGTGPRTWPRIRRRNWRRRLSRWRDRLHAAAAQGSQAEVHERGALEQNSGHGRPGSCCHSRRMHVPNPRRSLSGRSRPRSRSCGGRCSMAFRPWTSWDRARRCARHDRARLHYSLKAHREASERVSYTRRGIR